MHKTISQDTPNIDFSAAVGVSDPSDQPIESRIIEKLYRLELNGVR
jgi:hypothetical protein